MRCFTYKRTISRLAIPIDVYDDCVFSAPPDVKAQTVQTTKNLKSKKAANWQPFAII